MHQKRPLFSPEPSGYDWIETGHALAYEREGHALRVAKALTAQGAGSDL